MDDPTKDTIPRSAVEYCLRKETVNTNPDAYESHERFIAYMDDPDISQFGHWMHSNGFNCALTAISVDLKKIPSVTQSSQPGWIPCSERLPKNNGQVLVYARSVHYALAKYDEMREADGTYKKQWVTFDAWKPFYTIKDVLMWMPLPKPREGTEQ